MRPQPGYADDDTLELPRIRAASPSGAGAAGAAEPSPVFVDSSGRRQRRVRRLGWLLVVPAAGYVVLVLSSLFGGPTLESPFLPAPRSADAAPSKAPAAEPRRPSPSVAPRRTPAATGATSRPPEPTAPAPQAPPGNGAAPTAAPAPPTTNGNGASPGSGSAGQGKPTARPGQGGGKPTARP